MRSNRNILTAFAVLALCLTAVGIGVSYTDDLDAVTWTGGTDKGSADDPYTGVNCNSLDIPIGVYVAVGSQVNIAVYPDDGELEAWVANVTPSDCGLTASGGSITGTITKACTIEFGHVIQDTIGGATLTSGYGSIIAVEAPVATTPVTSITISGSSTVDVGSKLTLTATTSPSSADDRHVVWSITSGSSRVTYTTSDTTTGGRIVLTGVSAGSVTVKATAADGSGVSATKSITVEVPEYWYYINYDANGGTGGPDRTGDTATNTTSTLSIQVSSEQPSRSGYTFLGWSESSTATSPTYYGGEWIDVTYDDVDLYAVWKQNTQNFYAYLNYNANGGSGAPSNQSAYINAVSASGSKTFTIPSTVPTRSGYEFLGWSTSNTATTASYDAGDTISVAYGSTVNLYAVWKQAVITITGTPDAHGIVGSSWRYTPTLNTSGCTLSVSGASWLVASNGTISGTPTVAGDYTVTITASKSGYTSGTQTFTVTVLSNLSFTSSPTGGAIIYAV